MTPQRRLFDCFTFSNEWECLELRLHELGESVDTFVLVEADFTFQGGTKPLRFAEEGRERFPDFADRIMVVNLNGPVEARDPWEREKLQRNAISYGLQKIGATSLDAALIGDCDEIPRRAALGAAFATAWAGIGDGRHQAAFAQRLSFYHVDNHCYTTKWFGTQLVPADEAIRRGAQEVRDNRGLVHAISNGGWHFCNLGGPDRIIEKLESFSHDEVNLAEYKDKAFLERVIEGGAEMTGRSDIQFRREATTDLPEYLLEHRDRFEHLFSPTRLVVPKGGRNS